MDWMRINPLRFHSVTRAYASFHLQILDTSQSAPRPLRPPPTAISNRPPLAIGNGDDHRRQGHRPDHSKRDRCRSPIPPANVQQSTDRTPWSLPLRIRLVCLPSIAMANCRSQGWRSWSWGRGRTRRAMWAWRGRPALRWASGRSTSTCPRTSPRRKWSPRFTRWTRIRMSTVLSQDPSLSFFFKIIHLEIF